MPTDVETLMEMGFPQHRAERALAKTSYKGVQLAMDWLFAHEDDADIDQPFEAPKGHTLGGTPGESSAAASQDEGNKPAVSEAPSAMETGDGAAAAAEAPSEAADTEKGPETEEAKSLKCDDCGKLLKNLEAAEYHAAKTNHSNFSESTEEKKPLTEEEKKEQMRLLQEKMKQKRQEKEQEERQQKIALEKKRREHGKEVQMAKEKMKELEMKKIMEERRKAKEDERLARQRVKEQIEKDKRDRAAKFAKQPESGAAASSASPASPPAAVPTAAPVKKEYDNCRIQLRLPNGQTLTQNFGAKEPLAAVRLYVEMNRTDAAGSFSLMTSFPRKVFSLEDMERPLADLGLVPSAVLIVTKT